MKFRQVHLDFHTSEAIEGIGSQFDKKQFQEALKAGHVDSITVFSKCHHGWAYHPSKANEMHPHLNFDLLAAQIEAAHEIGVKTPVYLSAGVDEKEAHRHPEWVWASKEHSNILFDAPGYHSLCFNTPYLDVLLAQIKEVCENYDADGIFLDIVGVKRCYCPSCVKTRLERGWGSDNEEDALRLGEEVYANYLRRVRETIDSVKPGLPVFHNSGHIRQGRQDLAYGNTHLELESLPTGGWGYDHFPFSARYVQNLDMEYLGMTGKFHLTWGEFGGFKHPNALRYEAALSAAHGAKCSVGDQLAPNGKMDMTTYQLIGAAYQELEEKEPWLDGAKQMCDVALFSNEARKNMGENFQWGTALEPSDVGAGRMLLEGKYLFSVVDAQMDLSQYRVLVLPDGILLNEELKKKFGDFVAKGGKILASGVSGLDQDKKFAFDFGAEYLGENEYNPSYVRPHFDNEYETDFIVYGTSHKVDVVGGEVLAGRVDPFFNRTKEHFCSHRHAPSCGKVGGAGVVEGKDGIYIAWDIFRDYAEKGELICKKVVLHALERLLGEDRLLKTDLQSMGIATLTEQGDRYVAHLLYGIPTKRGNNVEIIEDLYPIHQVSLSVKLPKAVQKAYLAPQGTEIPMTMENGRATVVVPQVDCHQMVVFE